MNHRSAVLLRYRFRSLSQLRNHLYPAEGRTLFFFRDIDLAFGQRVSLDIGFDESEHHILLQGGVLSANRGRTTPGVWLEFVDTGLIRARLDGNESQRRQLRLGCEAMIQVDQNHSLAIGRMVDVSLGGARIVSIGDLRQDDAVRLRVLMPDPAWPQEIGFAQVVRADLGGVAVRFLRNDARTRAACTKLFNAVQDRWSVAAEGVHPNICCQNGMNLDPPPPALRALFTRHEVH